MNILKNINQQNNLVKTPKCIFDDSLADKDPEFIFNDSLAYKAYKAAECIFNDSIAEEVTLSGKLIEDANMTKLLKLYNHSRMQLLPIMEFLIASIGDSNSSLNSQYDDNPHLVKDFSKSTLYASLPNTEIDWSGLSVSIGLEAAEEIFGDTDRPLFFVMDDSPIERPCSRCAELQARSHNHNDNSYYNGFTLLSLGISDGKVIVPVGFSLVASSNDESLVKVDDWKGKDTASIKKTSRAGMQRTDACTDKMSLAVALLKEAMKTKLIVDYLLVDSWFSEPATVNRFTNLGLHVICMLKQGATKYKTVDGKVFNVRDEVNSIKQQIKQGHSFGSIAKEYTVASKDEQKGKIVFARNWRKSSEDKPYVAILSTDANLSGSQIQQYYSCRWTIEIMFGRLKGRLALTTGNRTRIFESNVAYTSIAFIRYSMIELARKRFFPNCTFRQVMKKFKDEATYTQTTKNMLIMAQIGKSSMLGLVDKFQQKLQEKHPECTPVVMPIIQELAESYSKEIVGEMLCNISVDDRERLYRLITHGNIVLQDTFVNEC